MQPVKIVLGACCLLLPAAGPRAEGMCALAYGSGANAEQAAATVQEHARRLIRKSGMKLVEPAQALRIQPPADKEKALQEGRRLMQEAKSAYEQLELEKAIGSFAAALGRIEAAFGILPDIQEATECLLYLGACNTLMGEAESAREFFLRALDFGGYSSKVLSAFPPNIQQAFEQVKTEWKNAPRGEAYFITEPPGAQLFVDGVYLGSTPLQVSGLRAAVHLGRVTKDGYLPWGGYLRLVAGKKRDLRVSLRPAAEAGAFFTLQRRLQTELARGLPGPAAAEMAELLGASRLLLVHLRDAEGGLVFRAFVIGDLKAERERVLDPDAEGYQDSMEELLLGLIKADGAREKRPVAAATVGEDELGLDLSDGEETAAGAEGGESIAAGGEEAADGAEDTPPAAEETRRLVDAERERLPEIETGREEKPAGPAAPAPAWYQGLWKRWWFWTAVGVLATGAAAGGYLLTSSPASGGRLTIQLH